jgi:hypothetical protein
MAGSPAAGRKLGDITWPPGRVPVSVQDARTLRDPDPGVTLAPATASACSPAPSRAT